MKNEKVIPFERVVELAENTVGIESGTVTTKTRGTQYVFARYLIISYWYRYLPPGVIATRLNLHWSMISHAMKQKLFNKQEFKYLKYWQQVAVQNFINAIESEGGTIKSVERKINIKA